MTTFGFTSAHHDEYLRRHRATPRVAKIRQDRVERKTR